MRPTRTHVALLLLGTTFLGAWWTVTAQEGLRPPAPVRPPSLATPSLRIDDNPLKSAPPLVYDNAPPVPAAPPIIPASPPMTSNPETTPPAPPILPLPEATPSAPPILPLPLPRSEAKAPAIADTQLPLVTVISESRAKTPTVHAPPEVTVISGADEKTPPPAPPIPALSQNLKQTPAPADGSEVIIIIPPEDVHKYQTGAKKPGNVKPAANAALPVIRDEPSGTLPKVVKSPIVRVQHGEESDAPPVNPIDDKNKTPANPLEVPTFPPPPALVPPAAKPLDTAPVFPPVAAPPVAAPPVVVPPVAAPPVVPRQDPPSAPPKLPSDHDIPTVGPSVPLQRPQPNATPATQVVQPEKGTFIGPAVTPTLPMAEPLKQPQRVSTQGDTLLEMNVKNQLFRGGPPPVQTHTVPNPIPHRGIPPLTRPSDTIKSPIDNAPTTPLVTVVKKGPATQTTGGVVQYHIHVRNIGHYAAQQVRVVDEIPSSIRLDYSDPVPTKLEGGKASWEIASLQPGEEKIFRLDLKPLRPGAVVSTATVHVSARYPFKLNVDGSPIDEPFPPDPTPVTKENTKPEITLPPAAASNEPKGSLKVRAPETSTVGSTVVFEVLVANNGTQPLTGLKLWVKLPEGLFHKAGKDIIADLPVIAAGKAEKFEVPVTAAKDGRHFMHFRITGVTGEPWNATHEIMIIGNRPVNMPLPLPPLQRKVGSLNLRVTPTAALALKRESEIRIDVTNEHSETVKQMQLLHVLPDGVDIVAVGDLGMYQPVTRTASWIVPALAPGESKSVTLRVMPQTPGQLPLEVVAKTTELGDVKAEQTLAVEGLTSLGIRLTGRDGNLALGKDTIYEVRVLNEGSAAATNIQVQVSMPPGMQPHKFAEGPTKYRIEGNTLTFDPLARLAPGTQMVYHVGGRAVAPGDHRIRAAVASEQQPTPLIREVQTLAFQAQ